MFGTIISDKIDMKVEKNKMKNFYTTQELVDEEWFPVRSTLTVKKLIESNKLDATDISTSPRFKRYRIYRDSVIRFMEEQSSGATTAKKTSKKKKK